MHSVRVNNYMKGWQNYKYVMPYKDEKHNKNREYYIEMNKEDTKRFTRLLRRAETVISIQRSPERSSL